MSPTSKYKTSSALIKRLLSRTIRLSFVHKINNKLQIKHLHWQFHQTQAIWQETYLVISFRFRFASAWFKCTRINYEWKCVLPCLWKACRSLINGGSEGKHVKDLIPFSNQIRIQICTAHCIRCGTDWSVVNGSDVLILPNVSSWRELCMSVKASSTIHTIRLSALSKTKKKK